MNTKATLEFKKAMLYIINHLFLFNFIIYSIIFLMIVMVWKTDLNSIIKINQFFETIGVTKFIKAYLMPVWKLQEAQLMNLNKPGFIELFKIYNVFIISYCIIYFIYLLLKSKNILTLRCLETINLGKENLNKHNFSLLIAANILTACLAFGVIFISFYIKIFHIGTEFKKFAYTPTVFGLYTTNILTILFLGIFFMCVFNFKYYFAK